MHTKPLPRVVAGAVVVMVTVSAFLTFSRGEAPASDSASATLPGISSGNRPTVEGSATTPPTSPASADAAEREAKKIKKGATKSPGASPSTGGGPQWTPTPAPNPQPEPEPEPEPEPTHKPSPTPSPKPSCSFVGTIFGCK